MRSGKSSPLNASKGIQCLYSSPFFCLDRVECKVSSEITSISCSRTVTLRSYSISAYQHIASANLAQRLISTSGGQKHVHSLEDQITVHLQTSNRFLLRNTPLGNVQPPVPTHWDAEEAAENVKSKGCFLRALHSCRCKNHLHVQTDSESVKHTTTWNLDRYGFSMFQQHIIKAASSSVLR